MNKLLKLAQNNGFFRGAFLTAFEFKPTRDNAGWKQQEMYRERR
jgi:hypothetical protein